MITTIRELINELQKFDLDKNINVFAAGNVYPIVEISKFDNDIDINCGWENINEEVK